MEGINDSKLISYMNNIFYFSKHKMVLPKIKSLFYFFSFYWKIKTGEYILYNLYS